MLILILFFIAFMSFNRSYRSCLVFYFHGSYMFFFGIVDGGCRIRSTTLGFYALNCSSWCVAQDFDNECLLDVWNILELCTKEQEQTGSSWFIFVFPLLSTMGCGESSELVSQHRSCTVWALKLYNSPGAQRKVLGESTGGRWNMMKLLGASWSPNNPSSHILHGLEARRFLQLPHFFGELVV